MYKYVFFFAERRTFRARNTVAPWARLFKITIGIRVGTGLWRNGLLVMSDMRCFRELDLSRIRWHDLYLDGVLHGLWRSAGVVGRAASSRYDELVTYRTTRGSFKGGRSCRTWAHGRGRSRGTGASTRGTHSRGPWISIALRRGVLCGLQMAGGPFSLALAAALTTASVTIALAELRRRAWSSRRVLEAATATVVHLAGRYRIDRQRSVAVQGRHIALHQLRVQTRVHQVEPAPFVRRPDPLVLAQRLQLGVSDLRRRAQRIIRFARSGHRKLFLPAATAAAATAISASCAVIKGHVYCNNHIHIYDTIIITQRAVRTHDNTSGNVVYKSRTKISYTHASNSIRAWNSR